MQKSISYILIPFLTYWGQNPLRILQSCLEDFTPISTQNRLLSFYHIFADLNIYLSPNNYLETTTLDFNTEIFWLA